MAGCSERIYEWHQSQEHPERIELEPLPRHHGDQVLDRAAWVYLKRDVGGRPMSVTYRSRRYLTGVRRDTGHRWFRWETDQTFTVRRTRTDRMMLINFGGPRVSSHMITSERDLPRIDALRDAVANHLGEPRTFVEIYPLAINFDLDEGHDPTFRACFEGVTDVHELTARLYGKKALRKSLIKAVATADVEHLYISWCLRRRDIPVDWHVDYLRAHPYREVPRRSHLRRLRPHVRNLDKTSIKRLLRQGIPFHTIRDIGRMCVAEEITSVRSWADLEEQVADADRVVREHELYINDLKRAQTRERAARRHEARLADPAYRARLEAAELAREEARIEQERLERKRLGRRAEAHDKMVASLIGATPAGVTIAAATDARTLLKWGKEMRQCIGSYSYALHDKSSILLGLYAGDSLIANAEIEVHVQPDGMRLAQLLGKRNATLEQEILDDVLPHLEANGVEIPNWWIGQPRTVAA